MEAKLYIVATPIGNLSDITLRAVDVLKNVDFIACEDTRVTKILLNKYNIKTKLIEYHKFNEKEKSAKLIDLIKSGKNIALVSDAGTPAISDPGAILVNELYKNNITVTSIPGACAVSVLLSLIPRTKEEYAFIGFMPRTFNSKQEILNKFKFTNCVFYESPNRLIDTLSDIEKILGKETKISIGRELTKLFEEVKTGFIEEIKEYYDNNPLKGEIAAMIHAKDYPNINNEEIENKIKLLKEEGFSPKDISKIISKLYSESKNKIYKMALNDF